MVVFFSYVFVVGILPGNAENPRETIFLRHIHGYNCTFVAFLHTRNYLFNLQGPRGPDGPPGEQGTQGIKVSDNLVFPALQKLHS